MPCPLVSGELSGPLFISLFKMYDFLLIKKNLSPSKVVVHQLRSNLKITYIKSKKKNFGLLVWAATIGKGDCENSIYGIYVNVRES